MVREVAGSNPVRHPKFPTPRGRERTRLAQLVERSPDTGKVTGSSPVSRTEDMRIGQQADLKSAIRRESVSGSNPESSAMESYAKLVEAASLEMRCDGFRLVSSNLTLSALGSYAKWPKQPRVLVNGVDGIDHLSCRFESYAFHHGRHAKLVSSLIRNEVSGESRFRVRTPSLPPYGRLPTPRPVPLMPP